MKLVRSIPTVDQEPALQIFVCVRCGRVCTRAVTPESPDEASSSPKQDPKR